MENFWRWATTRVTGTPGRSGRPAKMATGSGWRTAVPDPTPKNSPGTQERPSFSRRKAKSNEIGEAWRQAQQLFCTQHSSTVTSSKYGREPATPRCVATQDKEAALPLLTRLPPHSLSFCKMCSQPQQREKRSVQHRLVRLPLHSPSPPPRARSTHPSPHPFPEEMQLSSINTSTFNSIHLITRCPLQRSAAPNKHKIRNLTSATHFDLRRTPAVCPGPVGLEILGQYENRD
jgi:hypothetical protein